MGYRRHPDTAWMTKVNAHADADQRTIGLAALLFQLEYDPTYTRAGCPTESAAQYIKLAHRDCPVVRRK